jgi:hypothetical protein
MTWGVYGRRRIGVRQADENGCRWIEYVGSIRRRCWSVGRR